MAALRRNEYADSHRDVNNVKVEGSLTNGGWSTLVERVSIAESAQRRTPATNPGTLFRMNDAGASYRYIRVTLLDFHYTGDGYFGLMEVMLFSAATQPIATVQNFGAGACSATGLAFDGANDFIVLQPTNGIDEDGEVTIALRAKYLSIQQNFERVFVSAATHRRRPTAGLLF